VHALTEDKRDIMKYSFIRNILLGDFNEKYGEKVFTNQQS
jgi:hypothetical protein